MDVSVCGDTFPTSQKYCQNPHNFLYFIFKHFDVLALFFHSNSLNWMHFGAEEKNENMQIYDHQAILKNPH